MDFLPPIDIIIGLICIGVFGLLLGALIYLLCRSRNFREI